MEDFDKVQLIAQCRTSPSKEQNYNGCCINIDIMDCLRQEITYDMDEVARLHEEEAKHKSVELKLEDVETIKTQEILPGLDCSYHEFLPPCLENEWIFRFPEEKFLYSTDSTEDNIELVVYSKGFEVVTTDTVGNFQKHQKGGQARVLETAPYEKIIILLHDFYEHPMTMIPLINLLARHRIQVIVPYLGDVIDMIIDRFGDGYSHREISEFLCQLVQSIISYRSFKIIAHGTASIFGVAMKNHFWRKCKLLLLCSPIINEFELKGGQGSDQDEVEIEGGRSEQLVNNSFMQYSEEFTLQNTNPIVEPNPPLGSESSTHSEIQEIQQKQTLVVNKLVSNNTVQERCIIRKKKEGKKTPTSETDEYPSRDSGQHESLQCNYTISYINQYISKIFTSSRLVQLYMELFEVRNVEELSTKVQLDSFMGIYWPIRMLKTMQGKFIRRLYGLLVLSPLDNIMRYRENIAYFDKRFFETMSELGNCFAAPSISLKDSQDVIILVGSHDFLISDELKRLQRFTDEHHGVCCRLVYGCSHDMFATCPDTVLRLVE